MHKKYQNKRRLNPVAVVGKEKTLIYKHYDFLQCRHEGKTLYCYGEFQPTPYSIKYKYRIKYTPPKSPIVNIISPKIEYNDDIHMFPKNNSLCLYHKTDLVWDTTYNLYDTIIPWTLEWFVFYELYLISGKWEHPFVSHTGLKE